MVQDLASLRDYFRGNDRAVAGADLGDEVSTIGRADDGAAQSHDSIGAFPVQDDVISRWKESFKSITKAEDFPAKFLGGEHNSAQDGVKSRAIATTG